MGKRTVTCGGLGSGSPPSRKEVETEDLYGPHMSTQGVRVAIGLEAYERLVNWASMGRTLDGVLHVLEEATAVAGDDLRAQLYDAHEELRDVRAALDECHQAVRRHWGALK